MQGTTVSEAVLAKLSRAGRVGGGPKGVMSAELRCGNGGGDIGATMSPETETCDRSRAGTASCFREQDPVSRATHAPKTDATQLITGPLGTLSLGFQSHVPCEVRRAEGDLVSVETPGSPRGHPRPSGTSWGQD